MKNAGQLQLDVQPLSFVPSCLRCGATGEPIPVEPGANWNEAAAWAYLALKSHDKECPARPR
jgi:hypothetical protein